MPLSTPYHLLTNFFQNNISKIKHSIFIRVAKIDRVTVVTLHQQNESIHKITEDQTLHMKLALRCEGVLSHFSVRCLQYLHVVVSVTSIRTYLMYMNDLDWFPGANT